MQWTSPEYVLNVPLMRTERPLREKETIKQVVLVLITALVIWEKPVPYGHALNVP
jgi:hypothetical protein